MNFLKNLTPVKLFAVLFGTSSVIFWGFFYNQHLFRLEQLQLFELTPGYLISHLSVQGGFAIWTEEFMTQFFRVPFAGAIIITFLFFVLQRLTAKLFRGNNNKGETGLLSFIPSAVYWVLLTIEFYPLSGLIGIIISLAFVNLFIRKASETGSWFVWLLLIPIIWWLTGAAYLIYILCIVFLRLWQVKGKSRNGSLLTSVTFAASAVILTLVIPILARKCIISDTLLQSFTSEAYYQVRIMFPLPLIILIALFPLFVFIGRLKPEESISAGNNTFFYLIAGLIITGSFAAIMVFGGIKQEKEIRYENLVYNKKWDRIIRIAERENPTDELSLMAVNLALAKQGRLSSEMFRFRQDSMTLLPDYSHLGMTPFISSEPYYYMGFINYSQMYALETIESTIDTRYPSRSFKRAAETFIINGQYEIARKYLIPLSHTLFYRRWAKDCLMSLWSEKEIESHTEWRELRILRPDIDFYYNENQMDREMQMLLKANPANKVAFEYMMGYYLIKKNFDGFLLNIHLVNNMNYTEMPVAFQEAAVFINSVSPSTPPQLKNFPVKNSVMADFRSFEEICRSGGDNAKEIAMNNFGKSYWYYILFR